MLLNIQNKFPFKNRLDIILALFGVIGGIFLTIIFLVAHTMLILNVGVALFTVSLIYLYIRYNKISSPFFSSEIRFIIDYSPTYINIICNIVFWVCTTISLLTLLLYPNIRPPQYFLLIILCILSTIIPIIFIKCKNNISDFIKIYVIGFNLHISVYLFRSGNGGSGGDYWVHMVANEFLANGGVLSEISQLGSNLLKESSFPIMHIGPAISKIITDLPIKEASAVSILIPITVLTICVYLVTRELFGHKAGLLAMLLLMICDYIVRWSFSMVTTTYGLCIYFIIIFCIVKVYLNKEKQRWTLLSIVFVFIIVITHAISSYILLTTLLIFISGSIIHAFLYNHKLDKTPIFLSLILGITLVISWMYTYYNTSLSFFDRIVDSLFSSFQSDIGFMNTKGNILSEIGYNTEGLFTLFFDNLGFGILFGLSALTLFLAIYKKWIRSEVLFIIILSFCVLQFIVYSFPILGLNNIVPSRWFAFIYFFGSILMSISIIRISHCGKWTVFPIIFLIIIFSFGMITNSVANDDSPLYAKEFRSANSYTFAEENAGLTLSPYLKNNQLITDYYYQRLFMVKTPDLITQDIKYDEIESILLGSTPSNYISSVFVFREYMIDRPIQIYWEYQSGKKVTLKKVLGNTFKSQLDKYSLIYNIGDTTAYFIHN